MEERERERERTGSRYVGMHTFMHLHLRVCACIYVCQRVRVPTLLCMCARKSIHGRMHDEGTEKTQVAGTEGERDGRIRLSLEK